MRVVIDPGHGGLDEGASAHGLRECDVNLAVALQVERRLVAYRRPDLLGHRVLMTRRSDRTLSLSGRVRFANGYGAAAFVSIHANAAASDDAHGFEVFHFPGSTEGEGLASSIIGSLARAFPAHRSRGVKTANFHVLRETRMPAVLVETEFLTNPAQARWLSSVLAQDALGVAISEGVDEWAQP